MRKIRIGNDFIFLWEIERNGQPEDFSNAMNIRLHFKIFDCVSEIKSFQIVDGNIVRVEVSPEWASRLGAYRLILSYEFEDLSYSDGDRKCVVDVLSFRIVSKTSEADDVTEMAQTTDMMIGLKGEKGDKGDKGEGLDYNTMTPEEIASITGEKGDKGDKGDPFRYDDFTQQQLDDIQQPITDFVAVAEVAENQREINEGERVQADLLREQRTNTAIQAVTDAQIESEEVISEALNDFNTRVGVVEDAEVIREQQERDRQTNTAQAIVDAENATEDANTAAQNADDARLAIQDDLALKEATANKQNSLAPDGTGTKFPTVDAVKEGINNLLASYKLTSNTEIHMTALDPVTGIFTANNHGLTQDKPICWNLNTGVNLLPYQVIPVEITGGEYGRYYADIIDANNFRIKKTTTDQTLTFASAEDITKWHFETDSVSEIIISNLAPYKKIRVVTKIKSNQNIWFGLYPTNTAITGNNWYINGAIRNAHNATLNGWGSNMPAYAESEFYFDEISTIRHRIYGYEHKPSSPTTVTPAKLDLVWINTGNLGALTITDMRLASPSRFLLNGTTIEIYKI